MENSPAHPDPKPQTNWIIPVIGLTGAYLLISILWILLSDSLAIKIAGNNPRRLEQIQQFKGILFVALSGSVLFYLGRRSYRNLANSFLQKDSLEKKFLALNETAREGIFDCDLEKMTVQINNKMKFFFPASADMIEDFWPGFQKRIHPEDTARLVKEYDDIVSSGKTIWQTEYRLLGSDNKYYSALSSIYVLRNLATEKPVRLIGTILDISELRNLQAEQYEQQLNHKRELTASIIRAQENERNRWAEELHDNVCQILSVVKLYIGEMNHRPSSVPVLLPETSKLIADAIMEIRQLSATIKPPSFAKTSLKDALEKLASDINRAKDIRFIFDLGLLTEEKLCEEQKLLAYRVVQEQLNNIIKYADAKKVEIVFGMKNEKFFIKVKDDGKGFDPGRIKNGLGLRNIQSRLEHYKGNLNIDSATGKGCTLSAAFTV
ncbi:MAG: PAS domain-containing protein [Chitinophagaceae bacterium]|nr:PAS domain-containing protein [Chitinophagaceae bacterium]